MRVAVFPDWETLPYDTFSPHQDLISERLATLWRIRQRRRRRRADAGDDGAGPARAAGASSPATPSTSRPRQRLDEAALKAQLTLAGYTHVSQVVSPGEYAVRGGLIDLFPMGSAVPYRVDLFGDEVDSIRTFDPDTQRSLYPVPEVRLLPGREFPMDEAVAQRVPRRAGASASKATRPRCGSTRTSAPASPPPASSTTCRSSSTRRRRSSTTSARAATLALHGEIDEALQRFWADTRERHRFFQHDRERPILPPEALFLKPEEFFTRLRRARAAVAARHERRRPQPWATALPDLSVDRGAPEPLKRLQGHVAATPHRVLIVAESEGRRESLLELLRDSRIEPPSVATLAEFEAGDERFAIAVAPLAQGFAARTAGAGATTRDDRVHHRDRAVRDGARARAGAAARSRRATSTR